MSTEKLNETGTDVPATRPRPRPMPADAPPARTDPAKATPTATATAKAGPDAGAGRPARSGLLRPWVIVLSVLALGLLALNIWFLTIRSANDDVEGARNAAVASAQTRLPRMLSYSYKNISTFAAQAPQNATGSFRKSFTDLVSSVIVPAAKTNQIQTSASVKAIGVVRAQSDTVVVLALLDQSTTTKTTKTAQLDGSRVQVTMRHVDGKWLVADISPT